jgi:20S proteasome subunit beta 6
LRAPVECWCHDSPFQIYFKNQTPEAGAAPFIPGNLPLSTVLGLVVDSFTSATERHIEVGDGLEMYVVMKNGRGVEDLTSTGELPEGTEVEEMVAAGEGAGERTFLVRRALKRD